MSRFLPSTRFARPLALAGCGALLATGLAVSGASGQAPLAGYDGSNPFNCILQQAGLGTDFPDPGADPFCVEYDKRHQNVDTLGLVDFLAQEPARVAAAAGKCFYFQHDHWRSRLIGSNAATETYHWDGSYYFDLAKGVGGAYAENFTINHQTADPTTMPGFPAEYKPFFGKGRGGLRFAEGIPIDPRCVQKAREGNVYARRAGGAGPAGSPAGAGDGDRSDEENGGRGDAASGAGADGTPGEDPRFSETRGSPTFTG